MEIIKKFADMGFSFVKIKGKIPVEGNWQKKNIGFTEISKWISAGNNYGIRTGNGLYVIDIDTQDISTLEFPDTLTVRTGRGGMHLFYSCNLPLKNTTSKIFKGVDTRGVGGFVVGAGSIHPTTGTKYEITSLHPDGTINWNISSLPQWIIDRVVETVPSVPLKHKEDLLTREINKIKNASEGQRNDILNRVSYYLAQQVAIGMLDEHTVKDALIHATTLSTREATQTINSAFRAVQNKSCEAQDYVLVPGQHGNKQINTCDFVNSVVNKLPKGEIYLKSTLPVVIDNGKLRQLNIENIRLIIDKNMRLGTTNRKGLIDFKPCGTAEAGLIYHNLAGDPLIPRIDVITKYPIYNSDWELSPAGFFKGIYYDEPEELKNLKPKVKLDLFRELTIDFPFLNDESYTNFIAMLLTPIIRPAIDGNAPLFMVESTLRRTGKTKLVEQVLGGIILGDYVPAMQLPENEAEHDKRLLSILLKGNTILHLDNINMYIDSAAIASFLTSRKYEGRVLGSSTIIESENLITLVATGNKPQAQDDIVQRIVPITLEPSTSSPEERDDFHHPDLFAFVKSKRREVLECLIGMIEEWKSAGRPRGMRNFGGFEGWVDAVGGICEHFGLIDFLNNRAEWARKSDPVKNDILIMLNKWFAKYQTQQISARDIYEIIEDNELFLNQFRFTNTDRACYTQTGIIVKKIINVKIDRFTVKKDGKYYLEVK